MAVYEEKENARTGLIFWFEGRGRMGQRRSGMKHRAHVLSATILVLIFASPTVAQFPTEIEELRLAAEQGDPDAQSNLGIMYHNGEGVPQDYQEAVKWYRLAAEQGVASAQGNLGVMYDNGEGVPQDYVQAHKWINLAAASRTTKAGDYRLARDAVAEKMTASQVAEAQRLAREWQQKTWEQLKANPFRW